MFRNVSKCHTKLQRRQLEMQGKIIQAQRQAVKVQGQTLELSRLAANETSTKMYKVRFLGLPVGHQHQLEQENA